MINLARVDEGDHGGARDGEGAHKIKDPLISEVLAETTCKRCRREVATVVKALIAADALVQLLSPD